MTDSDNQDDLDDTAQLDYSDTLDDRRRRRPARRGLLAPRAPLGRRGLGHHGRMRKRDTRTSTTASPASSPTSARRANDEDARRHRRHVGHRRRGVGRPDRRTARGQARGRRRGRGPRRGPGRMGVRHRHRRRRRLGRGGRRARRVRRRRVAPAQASARRRRRGTSRSTIMCPSIVISPRATIACRMRFTDGAGGADHRGQVALGEPEVHDRRIGARVAVDLGEAEQQLGHAAADVEEDQVARLLGEPAHEAAQRPQQRVEHGGMAAEELEHGRAREHEDGRRLDGDGRRGTRGAIEEGQLAQRLAGAEGRQHHLVAVF